MGLAFKFSVNSTILKKVHSSIVLKHAAGFLRVICLLLKIKKSYLSTILTHEVQKWEFFPPGSLLYSG